MGVVFDTIRHRIKICACKMDSRVRNLGVVTVLLASLLTLILVVLPRESLTISEDVSVVVYDYSIIYRSLLIAGCGLFLLIGLVAYLTTHVMEPHYAKSLRRLRT
ncbi:transmembrane protein 218-like isoform X2 [Pecten maximus]|uniref:transmembrane protein 218-like isoform X2 n=1 Tax=Pecten maximus TaxID=6579 RepID=UPI001458FDB0|nr:transmembrane protein 218-like isoform X2 [Pecten maximus]